MRRWLTEPSRRAGAALTARLHQLRRDDRGDVPGWVMVTLMSALLVAAIFALAQTKLTDILTEALDTVLP